MGWWVYPLWKEMGVFRTCYQPHRCFFRYFQLRRLRSRQYLLWLASLLDHSHIHLCLRILLGTQKHNNHSFLGCLGSKVDQFQKTRFCSLSLEHFPYSTVGAGQPASLKRLSLRWESFNSSRSHVWTRNLCSHLGCLLQHSLRVVAISSVTANLTGFGSRYSAHNITDDTSSMVNWSLSILYSCKGRSNDPIMTPRCVNWGSVALLTNTQGKTCWLRICFWKPEAYEWGVWNCLSWLLQAQNGCWNSCLVAPCCTSGLKWQSQLPAKLVPQHLLQMFNQSQLGADAGLFMVVYCARHS